MQVAPPAGRQIRIERLLRQRMVERIAVLPRDANQLKPSRIRQRGINRAFHQGPTAHDRFHAEEGVEREGGPKHGRLVKDCLVLRRQSPNTVRDNRSHSLRHVDVLFPRAFPLTVGQMDGSVFNQPPEDLLYEERVPIRVLVYERREFASLGDIAHRFPYQLSRTARLQPNQRDALDQLLPA
jgi:hypothetical protein